MFALLPALGTALTNILASLITEAFLKRVIIRLLEAQAKRTASDTDDKFVEDLKKNWGIED